MLQNEFEAWLYDPTKVINGDIEWSRDSDHPVWFEFRTPLISESRLPVSVKGSFSKQLARISFSVIHRTFGRIYALDMGREHRNLDRQLVGDVHKHRWDEQIRSAFNAYAPSDITASPSDPIAAWNQFCDECTITHQGSMKLPPGFEQKSMFQT